MVARLLASDNFVRATTGKRVLAMTDMNDAGQMQELYGPLYKFSENKIGDVIRFRDTEHGELSGTILWVCPPQTIAGTAMQARYIVDARGSFPDTVFFNDVISSGSPRQDEPTLVTCPYCGNMHEIRKVQKCPMKPKWKYGEE